MVAARLLPIYTLQKEVIRLVACGWYVGDYTKAQKAVSHIVMKRLGHETMGLLIEWNGKACDVSFDEAALGWSLDDFSVTFLEPLVHKLSIYVFPPPANEDR